MAETSRQHTDLPAEVQAFGASANRSRWPALGAIALELAGLAVGIASLRR